jgi:PKD repeat protein
VANAGDDQLRHQGEAVTFDASNSHDIDGEITGCVWDFGDGSSYSETQDNAPDEQFDGITSHTYQDNGAYAVTLEVADNGGEYSSDNLLITVTNVAPQVSVVTPAATLAGQSINLAASFSDPGQAHGESYVVEVDWGDGQTTFGLIDSQTGATSSSHVYLSAGTYTIGVTVMDDGDHVSGQAASPLSGFATTHIQVIQPVRVDVHHIFRAAWVYW